MKRKRYIIAPHSASEKTVHLPAQFKEQGQFYLLL